MAAAGKNISRMNQSVFSDSGAYFGDVWYEPGGECGPRTQPDYQLVIVHLGKANVTFDDNSCEIMPGSVALMLPGRRELYRFSRRDRTHHTWCSVPPRLVPAPLRKRLADLPAVLTQSPSFDLLMKAAFRIGSWREAGGQRMVELLGLAALEEYVRMATEGSDETNRGAPVDRARRYLDEHCGEEDCLAAATRAASVTPQHLIRLFRRHFQVTPGRYLWRTRVERGAGMLAATGLTISEIADRCGFKNPFHFSRLLKKLQGISPREFRQRAWRKK
jgi:AraC-like DNA-binding protein